MKALDVAKCIINYCIGIENPVSNLQLQKILYFLDLYHLIQTKERLITDSDFEAWDYGPVISEIYKEYSSYACNPINIWQDMQDDKKGGFESNMANEKIYGYIDMLSKIHPSILVKKSHEDNSPWDKVKPNQYRRNGKITTELMEEYARKYR